MRHFLIYKTEIYRYIVAYDRFQEKWKRFEEYASQCADDDNDALSDGDLGNFNRYPIALVIESGIIIYVDSDDDWISPEALKNLKEGMKSPL
jgi:hypothetical protein